MLKLGVAGCLGRMGLSVLRAADAHDDAQIVAGSAQTDDDHTSILEKSGLGHLSFDVVHSANSLFNTADAVIDFTTPNYTLELAKEAAEQKKLLVSGTTGLTNDQFTQLQNYAKETPILWAANMSVGVTLLSALVEQAAKALDASYDIEIVEMHHKHKVDAPSGTALALGQAAASGRDVEFEDVAIKSREGQTGARKSGDIGFATLRGGSIIGEHAVMFAGQKDRFTLSHDSHSRDIYAEGAIKAALWSTDKPAGLYCMKDVLGLS